jgi:hypothetical protein
MDFYEKVEKMREAQKAYKNVMYHPDKTERERLLEEIKKWEFKIDSELFNWRNNK